jgi:hypothetical protein
LKNFLHCLVEYWLLASQIPTLWKGDPRVIALTVKAVRISIFHRLHQFIVIKEFTATTVYFYLFPILHIEHEEENNILFSPMESKTTITDTSNTHKISISNSIPFLPSFILETQIANLFPMPLFPSLHQLIILPTPKRSPMLENNS